MCIASGQDAPTKAQYLREATYFFDFQFVNGSITKDFIFKVLRFIVGEKSHFTNLVEGPFSITVSLATYKLAATLDVKKKY